MTDVHSMSKNNASNLLNNHRNNQNSEDHNTRVCQQLKKREKQWWKARQRLVKLRERQIFWYGENSPMMWLLWQLVSYVVVAIGFMLLFKMLNMRLTLNQYLLIFAIQTMVFITFFALKGRFKEHLQNKIYRAELHRDQALNEMIILASDSIFPDIHTRSPLSLKSIHQQHNQHLRLASLHCLLNTEVDAGRLILQQQQIKADVLPLELADNELSLIADSLIYKSII